MRDINDLNYEYLSDRAFRTKYIFPSGSVVYIGKLRTDEWMVKKLTTSGSTTTYTYAHGQNNDYDNLDDAWTNKLTLTYE